MKNTDKQAHTAGIECKSNWIQIAGLLLLRVRDELRMTLHAFQTLYESSIAFGIRKALQAEQGKTDMETKISRLEDDKAGLEKEVSDLKRYQLACSEHMSHSLFVTILKTVDL